MSILSIILLAIIILGCLAYVVVYIRRPFKDIKNPCVGCPYANDCKKIIDKNLNERG